MNKANTNIGLMTLVAFGLIIFGVRLYFIHAYGTYMPYWDDWGMGGFLHSHQTTGIGFAELFKEVNTHRQVFGKLTSIILFEANNEQWDVFVMMMGNAIIWTACGLFLIHIARKCSNEVNSIPIVLTILVIWTYPISLVNALWGVQSHVYFMTLFAIIGCWNVSALAFTKTWWVGVFCLFAGGLTLSGGSLISVSVAFVYFFLFAFGRAERNQYLPTLVASTISSAFGLMLLLIQPHSNSTIESNLLNLNAFITISKTLSWPLIDHIWPFFIFFIPILVVMTRVIKHGKNESRLIPLVLSLYGFIALIGISIAAARSYDGAGPARRYMDFVILAFVASSFALLIIQQKHFRLPEKINQFLLIAWLAVLVIAIPVQLEKTFYTIKERTNSIPYQEKYLRQYMNSFDKSYLVNKLYSHIPFPRPEELGDHLQNFDAADILPYSLQKATPITHNPEQSAQQIQDSPFIHNGFYMPNLKIEPAEGWQGELVMGSFNHVKGGNLATGDFESNSFKIDRPNIMVPIIGYTGYPDLSLKLVEVFSNKEYEVKPPEVNSSYAELWREVLVKADKGYYKLVAQDNNEKLWFGFAAPRSVGRLSYLTQRLLQSSQYIYLFGIILFCFIHRRMFADLVTKKT